VVLGFQLRGSYQLLARFLKWLTLGLFAYVLASVLAHPDPGAVLRGTLVPTFAWDEPFLATLVAILGTTLSPYLFFWQASQQVEEKIATGRRWIWQRRGASNAELKYLAWDVNAGMAFSNVVMYFIILGTAATLHEAGKTDVATAADAAQALRPLAGDAAGLLFALGFIGVGMLAIPVLTTGAAYALSDALGWPATLHAPPERAKRFYAVIVATTIVGMALNFVGINPIQALVGVAVLNGLLLPVLLAVVLVIANRRAVMGERVNGAPLNFLCGATLVVSVAAALGLAWTFVQG
jgi:Mn2+/Fe2+ NRAMP family transporter